MNLLKNNLTFMVLGLLIGGLCTSYFYNQHTTQDNGASTQQASTESSQVTAPVTYLNNNSDENDKLAMQRNENIGLRKQVDSLIATLNKQTENTIDVENTKAGMRFINTYFRKQWIFQWPGGKDEADKPINSYLGDNFFFALGWLASSALDNMGHKYKWYTKHKL